MDVDDDMWFAQVITCIYALLAACTTVLVLIDEEEQQIPRAERVRVTAAKFELLQSLKRKIESIEEAEENSPRKRKRYDYERARLAIQQDYLGPEPQFGDKQFTRIFRLTRGIVEKLIQTAGNGSEFFTQRHFRDGEPAICPEAKVLMGLKQLAFGVGGSAFLDYFQMGLTTANSCLKNFAKVIANDPELRGKYLRDMSKSDARKASDMHQEMFGIPGCLGCLDCMHVYWRTCPTAWKGHYQGKDKGKASIVLEGVADYNCWLWHSAFGPPGSNDDINIFDRSSLLRAMLDGTLEEMDFEFTINNIVFSVLWHFVDGIYPEITRFVKTVSIPLGNAQTRCAAWQEGARKSVERAFGILQRKFQILQRPVELFYSEEIKDVVDCCVILHGMMVEVRVVRDEEERCVNPQQNRRSPLSECPRAQLNGR